MIDLAKKKSYHKNESFFPGEIVKNFDKNKYPFTEILKLIFKVDSLDQLHNNIESFDQFNGDLGQDSESEFHKIFYKEIKKEDSHLRAIWELFIKNEVKKHFPLEELLIIQKLPNIRFHIPNGKAINRWHCDSDADHKHPLGEINCVLPLTNMFGTNSFWRESEPNKGDFKPFHLEFGEIAYWNGNTCIHGNKTNSTFKTRVSFDFRVFPQKKYEEYIASTQNIGTSTATMGTKFTIGGYYKQI